ncbi:MAG: hypothetical protein GY714_18310 [Desulfobacterales bacterium]|nr:hypothetical protein [Desulfobacterales bacterium]
MKIVIMGITLLCFIVIVTSSAIISVVSFGQGHKQGQIEALTGTIKYHLVTHEDQTVTWEEIEGE